MILPKNAYHARRRRQWYSDRRANDEGYRTRHCIVCESNTEHEGVYCVPCWNNGLSRPQSASQR